MKPWAVLASLGRPGFCARLAETLAEIHEAGGTAGASLDSYRLYYDRARAVPAYWMTSAVWHQATAVVRETGTADRHDADPP